MYGTCVRFYSTVVDWTYLQRMKEDLIERITSKIFGRKSFSDAVLKLCVDTTKQQQEAYLKRIEQITLLKPIDVGVSPYLTLDRTGNIEKVYQQLQRTPGDIGGSNFKVF